MVVEAGLARLQAVAVLAPAGDRDEHGFARVRRRPKLARQRVPVQLGKSDVEERDVGSEFTRRAQRLGAVVRDEDLVAETAEDEREARHEVHVVVGEQDPVLRGGG